MLLAIPMRHPRDGPGPDVIPRATRTPAKHKEKAVNMFVPLASALGVSLTMETGFFLICLSSLAR